MSSLTLGSGNYMENKRNWRLRYWIIGGYAVPITALMISTAVTIVNTSSVKLRSEDLVSSFEVKSLVDDLDSSVQSSTKSIRGYLLDRKLNSVKNYQTSQDVIKESMAKLSAHPGMERERQYLIQLEKLLSQLSDIDNNLIAKVGQGKVVEAVEAWSKSRQRSLVGDISGAIDEMQDLENQKVTIAIRQQQESLNSLGVAIALASGSSLLLSVMIGLWVIRRTAQQMHTSASAIATSTTEISATIEQQERAAIQQVSSVNQTTTTMDELGASSRQSAEQAKASAENAQQILLLVDAQGLEKQTNESSLREKVGDIANQILHLNEQTNQIGVISTLVSDLANQTNMLALNAAVEAVRAGEHGKGFAVVAAEIRKLADQSKSSAEKINELVVDIQKSTNSTVMVTGEGTKTVEKIVDAMKKIVINGQQISLTSNQQAIAVQQVVAAMNSLNTAARETASGISQIKVGTQRLNEAAQELKTVV